jgi:hypothetical protein
VQLADARRVVTNARRGLARGRTQPTAWQPPGEATVRRVLARIDADRLDRTIGAWLADQQPPPANPSPPMPRSRRRPVAIDGKTLRLRHEVARDEWLRWRRFDVMSKT